MNSGVVRDQNRVRTALDDGRKGAVKLGRAAYRHRLNLKPQCRAGGVDRLQGRSMRRRGGVEDDGNAREPGNGALEQLQAFDACLRHHHRKPGDVAARPREAGHVAGGDRVRVAHEDDGDRRGRPFRRLGVDGTWYDDDIDLEPNKFLRQFAHPFWLPLRPPVLDGDVPTLHVAQVAKPLPKSFGGFRKRGRTVPQKTDAVDLRRLLRMRGEWRKNETDSENDREPDQPHGHLG